MEKEQKKKSEHKENLIGMAEKIVYAAENQKLDLEKMEEVRQEIRTLGKFLKISPLQTVLFSTIFALSLDEEASINTMADFYGCSPMRLMTMYNDIDSLGHKRLIERCNNFLAVNQNVREIKYEVPVNVVESLKSHNPQLITDEEKESRKDLSAFMNKLLQTFDKYMESRITFSQLLERTTWLIRQYGDDPFVRFVDDQLTAPASKLVLFIILFEKTLTNNRLVLAQLGDHIFEGITERFHFKQQMLSGSHELLTRQMLILRDRQRLFNATVWLSDKVTEHLAGHRLPQRRDKDEELPSPGKVINASGIKEIPLFFNGDLQDDTELLERLIRDNNLATVKKRLSKSKITPGITALMYGPPGTGKTEFAYQLARKTGRDLMAIDLSLVKSKWIGESEKEVKKIFDDYHALRKSSSRTPILFLNEADGLLTKRVSISDDDNGSMQSQNAMQNILLQEMEDFEGILLATTNMHKNFDKAFDRRFLFKIQFEEPDAEVRQIIWQTRLPELTEEQAAALAAKYTLSGGEIENVIKQALLQQMAGKGEDLYTLLEKNCNKEKRYNGREIRKVGF